MRRSLNVLRAIRNDCFQYSIDRLTTLETLEEHQLLEWMFAKKPGLPLRFFPITHSAIGLRVLTDDAVVIMGRQSPWDLTYWIRDGFTLETKLDNEKKYLHSHIEFQAFPSGVVLTKAESQQALESADKLINQSQFCDMLRSNCYSFSGSATLFAIEAIMAREIFVPEDASKLLSLFEHHALADHAGIGVTTNPVLMAQYDQVRKDLAEKLKSLPVKDCCQDQEESSCSKKM